MRALALVSSILLAQGASAFVATPMGASRTRGSVEMMAERSKSVPFLQRPPLLDGTLAGDVGFDPLGLSQINQVGIDLYWMREAEIKHCRIAMLATAGILFPEMFGPFPGFPDTKSQMDVFWQVYAEKPTLVGFGILATIILEIIQGVAIREGRKTGVREPGQFFFDPLRLSKPSNAKKLQENELQNGRAAMIAAAGLILQGCTTHQGGIEALGQLHG